MSNIRIGIVSEDFAPKRFCIAVKSLIVKNNGVMQILTVVGKSVNGDTASDFIGYKRLCTELCHCRALNHCTRLLTCTAVDEYKVALGVVLEYF